MLLRRITLFAALLVLISSCSDAEIERDLKDHLSAYMNGDQEVIAFGNANLTTILNKADYKSINLANALIGSQVKTLSPMLDIDGAVYYAATGPLDNDGSPERMVIFVKVKDKEMLRKHLQSEMSFDLNEGDGFTYGSDGDMAFGFREHLAVIIIKKGEFDQKKELTTIFEKADGDLSTGKIAEVLNQKSGDMQLGMSLANLYGTAEGDLAKLPQSKRKELEKLLKDAFVNATFRFENGEAIIEVKNHFNPALKNEMFMGGDPSAPILKELGGGTPRIGFSMNMDVKKFEKLTAKVSPDGINTIGGPGLAMMKLMSGTNQLGEIVNGKAGLLLYGEPDESGAFTPQINAFIGVQPKGRKMFESAQDLMGSEPIPGIPSYVMGNNGVSTLAYPVGTAGPLKLPKGAENFGKDGINFFINLEGLNPEDIEEMFGMEELGTVMKVAKFISFELDNDGARLRIIAKDGKENILKQAMEVVVKDLQGQLRKMAS